MRWRQLVTLVASAAAAWLLLARAQQPDPVRALWLRILHLQAEAAADKVGAFLREIESQVGWTTQLPLGAGSMEHIFDNTDPQRQQTLVEERRLDDLRLLRQVPAITTITQLDFSGREQLRVSRLGYDYDKCLPGVPPPARQEVGGIGIGLIMRDGLIRVVTPLDGTPAAKAGILENDIITKLDGEPVQGFTLNQAVEKMHGPVGTKVTLTIVRMGEDKSIDLTITREPIRILAAESRNASPVIDWSSCLDAEATADRSKEPEFSVAMAKRVYYGPVYIGRRSEPYMTLSLAGTGRYSGVSVAEVNLRLIWDIVSGMKIGERGVVYVVDADGKLIAHPDLSLVLSKTNLSGLAQVQAARAATSSAAGEPSMRTRDIQGRDVLAAFAPVARGRGYSACACQGIGWSVLVELPTDEAGVQ